MNYCIYGSEAILVKEKIDEIVKQWLSDNDEMNLQIYDTTSHFTILKLIEEAWTIPFFATYKVILVRNCGFLSTSSGLNDQDQQLLLDYLKKPCESTVIIFSGEYEKMDNRKKIVKSMQKLCQCFSLNHMELPQWHVYVRQQCQVNNLKLDHETMEELLQRLPSDMLNFKNILKKLVLYPKKLDKEMIKKLVTRPLEENVFELVNAVVVKDLKKAMHCWRDLQVINTDPIALIALIGGQFRLLFQVKILSQQGYSESSIASTLKVHPYRVKLACESARSILLSRISSLIDSCAQLDQDFKMGQKEKNIGFENFLILATRGE